MLLQLFDKAGLYPCIGITVKDLGTHKRTLAMRIQKRGPMSFVEDGERNTYGWESFSDAIDRLEEIILTDDLGFYLLDETEWKSHWNPSAAYEENDSWKLPMKDWQQNLINFHNDRYAKSREVVEVSSYDIYIQRTERQEQEDEIRRLAEESSASQRLSDDLSIEIQFHKNQVQFHKDQNAIHLKEQEKCASEQQYIIDGLKEAFNKCEEAKLLSEKEVAELKKDQLVREQKEEMIEETDNPKWSEEIRAEAKLLEQLNVELRRRKTEIRRFRQRMSDKREELSKAVGKARERTRLCSAIQEEYSGMDLDLDSDGDVGIEHYSTEDNIAIPHNIPDDARVKTTTSNPEDDTVLLGTHRENAKIQVWGGISKKKRNRNPIFRHDSEGNNVPHSNIIYLPLFANMDKAEVDRLIIGHFERQNSDTIVLDVN